MNYLFSPSNIELLLWCHVRVEPHPRIDAPAIAETIAEFLKMGVIEKDEKASGAESNVYKTTPLGRAWVQSLCDTPPPVLAYVDQMGKIIPR